ncbi:10834_t:CDS:2 [Funneliformis caledonium]|uniref:10834_t:CDS:1 n=1 Tax=Funneliformis caledonium TaxID=1117310 RepID=A0A9N9DCS2_9GLOM|nr:10834_t:CDS:2 [Funneliformis caledonium]
MAKACKAVFKSPYVYNDYIHLRKILEQVTEALLKTLRYLLDGGLDIKYGKVNDLFTNIARDANLHKLLDGWYIRTTLLRIDIKEGNATENNSDLKISSIHLDFQNIQVRGL